MLATVRPGGVSLAARVTPTQSAVRVTFQRWTASGWKNITTARTGADGHARATWNPAAGSYKVCASFLGSTINRPSQSTPIVVRVP